MEITEMTLLDFEEIKDILEVEFDEFWKPSILKSELKSENSKYIVAKKNTNILGFAGIITHSKSETDFTLERVKEKKE